MEILLYKAVCQDLSITRLEYEMQQLKNRLR